MCWTCPPWRRSSDYIHIALGKNYGALGDYDAATVAAAEMIIRRANVLEGRDAYARAAQRLARPATREDEEDEATVSLGPISASPDVVRDAGDMLEDLFSLAEAVAKNGPAAVIDSLALRDAAAGLGLPELVARDLRALAELDSALAEIGPAAADVRLLRQLLAAATCPPARTESVVDVLDVLDARPLRYGHVFLLGAAVGQFPRRFTDSSLISESDRALWARRGANLDCRRDLTAREMLLFYLAVSRADCGLTISFQQSDQAGRPGAPGSFLLSLLAPFGGLDAIDERGRLLKLPPGRFLPDAADLAGPGEALGAAMAGLFEPARDPDSSALAWAAEADPKSLARCAGGLFAFARRWTTGPCDSYDGRVTHQALLSRLARRFPAQTVFSATRLNAYAQCPWSFFARYVLKLAPLDVPQRELQPVARGIFCHNVLFRVMASLRDRFGPEVRLGAIDESDVAEALDGAVAAESAAVDAAHTPYPALWDIQRRGMKDDLADYLHDQRPSALDPVSLHFELAFGTGRAGGGLRDPASTDEPITIDTPAGPIGIRGKIDRIDRIRLDDVEGLLVVDYKTGRLPRAADINAGLDVQLPLYAAAVGRLLDAQVVGGSFHKIGAGSTGPTERLFAAVKKRGDKYSVNEQYQQNTSAVFERIGGFIDAMRTGRFDTFDAHNCASYCPYRQICHHSDARAEIKAASGEAPTGVTK